MQQRSVMLIFLFLVLSALYACFFIDWKGSHKIRLSWHVIEPGTAREPRKTPTVQFLLLDKGEKVTSVKVVARGRCADEQISPRLVVHDGDPGAVPVTAFFYGGGIRGMKPDTTAQPSLEAGQSYRLIVASGRSKEGELTFQAPQ